MRRFLCCALAAVMLVSLAACGGEPQPTDSTEKATAAATEPTPNTEKPTEKAVKGNHDVLSLDFIQTFDQKPAIKGQSFYKKDGLAIAAKSLRYDTVKGPQIILSIRNDTDKELLIQNNYTVVNDFMIKPELDVKIAPGKKAETAMSLPYLALAMADIHSLFELEFSLRILDSKTYEVVGTTEAVSLELTGVTEQKDDYDESGQVAYDDNGVKVIVQGVKKDTLFDSRCVLTVYMVNDTDKTISVQNKTLTVNGYDITAAMETVILAGRRAVDKIELFDSELDEYGIADPDSINVDFEINDYEVWKTIASTDTLSVEIATEAPTEAPTDPAQTEAQTD